MAIVRQWSGDGLSTQTLTTSTVGTGDDAFNQVVGTLGVVTSGTRSPRILVDQQAATFAYCRHFTDSALGDFALRFYIELTALASGSFVLARGGTDTDTPQSFRLDIAGTGAGSGAGQLRLRDVANTQIDDSGTDVLPINQLVRLEMICAAGNFTARAYSGETTTLIAEVSGSVGTTTQYFRYGTSLTTPTAPDFYMDDIVLTDTATWIGAVAPVGTSYAWTLYNGTSEVPLTLDGVYNGSTIDSINSIDIN